MSLPATSTPVAPFTTGLRRLSLTMSCGKAGQRSATVMLLAGGELAQPVKSAIAKLAAISATTCKEFIELSL